MKNSYVKTKPRRTVRAALLRPWESGKYTLRGDSLRDLIVHIGFESPWPNTEQVYQPVRSPRPVHRPQIEPEYYRAAPTIPYNSNYYIPTQQATTANRPAQLYRPYEQTPLLQPTHRQVRPLDNEDSVSGCASWLLLVLVFALMTGLAWHYGII